MESISYGNDGVVVVGVYRWSLSLKVAQLVLKDGVYTLEVKWWVVYELRLW